MAAGQRKELLKIQRNGITLSAAGVSCGIWQQRPEAMQSRSGRCAMANKPFKHKDLFAAIDHHVIDSPAFAELKGESVRLLLIIARQYDGRNNGHLQATLSYTKDRGISSKQTLKRAIADLISHGFIYRTRSHGFEAGKNTHSRYAITWRKLSDNTKGLFPHGFKMRAWQNWPFDENSEVPKVSHSRYQKCTFIPPNGTKSEPFLGTKSEPYEELAINRGYSEVMRFDCLTAELRKQAIKGRKQGSRKNLAFSVATVKPHLLEWRH